MELGPELFELLNARQKVGTQIPVSYGARGLTSDEIGSIEAQLGFRVPDDFAYLIGNLQDPGRVLFPWSEFNKRRYDEKHRMGSAWNRGRRRKQSRLARTLGEEA